MHVPANFHRPYLALAAAIALIACVAGARVSAAAPASRLRIAPVPAWVVAHEAPRLDDAGLKSHTGASYWLLLDYQYDCASQSKYVHIAIRILSHEGVQAYSEFGIDHDPSYQSLLLHSLRVRRGERVINKLGVDPVETTQRESSAESFLYDGTLTSSVHLSDIRAGDVIEYAYTTVGANPAYAGRIFDDCPLELPVPVERYLLRVRVPDGRKVEFTRRNTGLEPQISRAGGVTIYDWSVERAKPRVLDNNLPAWYSPYASVRFTDFKGWGDVAAWAVPLFHVSDDERARLRKMASESLTFEDSPSAVLAAIRFVQDEVRYLALVQGLSAYRPHPPTRAWQQRYGDCKDKSLLLSTLLNEMGAQAHPMLVRSTSARAADDLLVAPTAFDHCVVAFRYHGEQFFVDPTISQQGGDLDHLYFPNYGFGLVVAPETAALTPLPEAVPGRTSVTEHFDLDEEGGATLSVATEYRGWHADVTRSSLATHDLTTIQNSALAYYAAVYPDIEPDGDIRVTDGRRDSDNVLVTIESYRLKNLWARAEEDTSTVFLRFYPLALEDLTLWNSSPNRTMPFEVGAGEWRHEYIIDIFGWMPIAPENVHIAGDGFDYRKQVSLQGDQVSVTHEYRRTKRTIEPDQVAGFVAAHDRIRGNLSFLLIPGPLGAGGISWFMVGLMVVCVAACTFGAVRVFRRYDPEPRPARRPAGPAGIRGWLLVAAVGVVLAAIASVYTMKDLVYVFDARLVHGFGAGFTVFLVCIVVMAVVRLAFLLLVVWQFFARRTGLVRLFLVYLAVGFSFVVLNLVLMRALLPPALAGMETSDSALILRPVLLGALWVPYFLYSERVRRTFVRRGPLHVAPAEWQTATVDVPRHMPDAGEQRADEIELRAREMLDSGMPASEVVAWLTGQGLSAEMAALVIRTLARHPGPGGRSACPPTERHASRAVPATRLRPQAPAGRPPRP